MLSIFSESERAWLARRAATLARETGEPFPIAWSMAVAELTRARLNPKADVVPIHPRKSRRTTRDE